MIELIQGDSRHKLKELGTDSIETVITDAPYGLNKIKGIAGLVTAWAAAPLASRARSKAVILLA